MYEYLYGCMYVCMYVCMDGWMDGWMDGRMDGWMNGWMDGWMDEFMYICVTCIRTFDRASECPSVRACLYMYVFLKLRNCHSEIRT